MGNDGNLIVERTEEKEEKHFTENSGKERLFVNADTQKSRSVMEVFVISSYPPRECGIADYSKNLINALNNRFTNFYRFKVCALERGDSKYYYPEEVCCKLNVLQPDDYTTIANQINSNENIQAVVVQHEFDLFEDSYDQFSSFLKNLSKPVAIVLHSVIPSPSEAVKTHIQSIADTARSVIVMAKESKTILVTDYNVPSSKIEVIPYGTHLISSNNASLLKDKYKLTGRTIITSFGLLTPGKGIETVLEALPQVIKLHPEIMYLIIGKTHPEVLKKEGESYRIMLEARIKSLKLQNHVQFINAYFPNDILKEYLLATDVCVFSCLNPNRPMSGTFSFAVSCGCPIVSTPTPHAVEFISDDAGFTYNYGNSEELSEKINLMLENPALRKTFSENITRKAVSAAWENSAVSHAAIINNLTEKVLPLVYKAPPIKFDFIRLLTDRNGILTTSYKGEPDIRSGYTLDDNALALFVACMHYKITSDINDITLIRKYLKFIYHCYQSSGTFLKYMDYERKFTSQNYNEDLEESQAKAVWALGYLVSMKGLLPMELIEIGQLLLQNSINLITTFKTGHSIAFSIKGFYYYYSVKETAENLLLIKSLADKLLRMYQNTSKAEWKWFEGKFSNAGSVMPGALLNTWLLTGEPIYKNVAIESFDFLASRLYKNGKIDIFSSEDWDFDCLKNNRPGEKPCDIAFNVVALSKFYLVCKEKKYYESIDKAFNWFLGNNRLGQIVYNPVTGSCFDGLKDNSVKLSQSADSTLCYMLARMVVEKYKFIGEDHIIV